jgi:phospholipid transport system substrate-binding protein
MRAWFAQLWVTYGYGVVALVDHPRHVRFRGDGQARIGAYWHRLTPPQRTQFVSLFGTLFERSYNNLVLRFLSERESIYGRESITQDRAVVQTTLVAQATSAQLPTEYWLIHQDQRWAVVDVIVDGVSLALNYRAQFDQIIQSSSYDTLLQRIGSKVEEGSS